MEYHEAANFLLGLRRYRMRPGVEATRALLAHLGDPHEGTTIVQIAGSNGKGSTARMCESILREAGLDVGLFTSPHLDDVRERVRINGRRVTEAAVSEFADSIHDYATDRAASGESPTFFEATTALALWAFDRADVDVAVLEAGIGGRHDATSAVTPDASAVTSVAREHTDVLGDEVEEIAADKASVAPPDRPLITATTGAARTAVREAAGDLLVVGDDPDADVVAEYGGRANRLEADVSLRGPDWAVDARLPLLGEVQARNAGIAVALARQIADVGTDTVARGLRTAYLPGRFEVVGQDPLVILDGAHNPNACEAVAGTLAEFDYDDLHLVFGAMHDKDYAGMAAALPTPTRAITCEPDLDRAADADALAEPFRDRGVETVADEAVATALERARGAADPGDCVLVTGSLFVVAEARRRFVPRRPVEKRAGDPADVRAALDGAHVPAGEADRVADDGVHRLLHGRFRPAQVRSLASALAEAGGNAAVSGVETPDREPTDAVLMGTDAEFEAVLADLDERGGDLPSVAADLRASLGGRVGTALPWSSDGTAVMGILNVTPDSFHDGGRYEAVADAVERAEEMVAAGADVIDVGGESTSPAAEPISVDEELDRVVPAVEAVAERVDVPVSVDTRRAAVADAALDAGADVVNDVSGLADPEMRFVVADHDAGLVVMHSIEAPVNPEREVEYDDVVEDVLESLSETVLLAEKAGVPRERIAVDPGIGFGKTAPESWELLSRLGEFRALGCPVLVGHSHKSMFDRIDRYPDEGGYATAAATALAAERGADVVRVHDVAENAAAVRAAEEVGRLSD